MGKITIIIIIIIAIAAYFAFRPTDVKKRKKSRELYDNSSGIFDEKAAKALEAIDNIGQKNATDEFTAGNITGLNILQGELSRARANPNLALETLRRYDNAIHNVAEETIGERMNQNDTNPAFIIDNINDFAVNNLRDLGQIPDDFWAPVIGGLEHIIEEIPEAQQAASAAKKKKAAKKAKNRAETISNYFENSIAHTTQPQNTHDTSVVDDLDATYKKLEKTAAPGPNFAAIEEAENFLEKNKKKFGQKYSPAKEILSIIKRGDVVSTYNSTEDRVFKVVWDRTKLAENAANAQNMRESIIYALDSCMENGMPVCMAGRCARVLGSLVLQDYDESVGAAQTQEEYKNEIYNNCREIIDRRIELAQNSDSEEMRKVAESYINPKVECSPEFEEQFKAEIRKDIDDLIEEYRDKLRDYQIEKIRADCYASID